MISRDGPWVDKGSKKQTEVREVGIEIIALMVNIKEKLLDENKGNNY